MTAAFPVVGLAVLLLYALSAPQAAYGPTALVMLAGTAIALRSAGLIDPLDGRPRSAVPAMGVPLARWQLAVVGAVATAVLSLPVWPYLLDGVVGGPTDGLLLVAALDWQWHAL
ncbi:MAG TPA: hypothetical protein VGA36_06905, partial [Nitriliruptorales bacterium]